VVYRSFYHGKKVGRESVEHCGLQFIFQSSGDHHTWRSACSRTLDIVRAWQPQQNWADVIRRRKSSVNT